MLPHLLSPSQGQTGLHATLTLACCGDGPSSTTLAPASRAEEPPSLVTGHLDLGLVILTLCPGLTSPVHPDL